MLDQNTDRMWYVIGAVIIGAAIIFIMNNTFPQLFASIGNTFGSATGKATLMIDREFGKDNIIGADDLHVFNDTYDEVKLLDYNVDIDTWTLEIPVTAHDWSRGLQVNKNAVSIPYGATITTSFEIFIPEGVDGIKAVLDINNSYKGLPYAGILNDNDPIANRQWGTYKNGQKVLVQEGSLRSDIALDTGKWTHVWFSYSNTSELNTKKLDLYDYSQMGPTNPTDGPLVVQIRNVYGALDEVEKGE